MFVPKRAHRDPARYTLQAQGRVTFADPFSHKRFHTQLFGQVVAIQNFALQSKVAGLQLGGQLSVDIVSDRWNLFFAGRLGRILGVARFK